MVLAKDEDSRQVGRQDRKTVGQRQREGESEKEGELEREGEKLRRKKD